MGTDARVAPILAGSLSAGVTIEVSHGYRVTSREDAFVKKADVFGENFADATLLSYAVDWLPWRACDFFPFKHPAFAAPG